MFSRLLRTWPGVAITALLAVTLSGCGVHWDYGRPILPDLPPQTQVFQKLINDEVRFSAAAQQALQEASCAECQPILTNFIENSTVRIDTLGGVWNPWPQGAPQGAQQPEAAPAVTARTAAELAVEMAREATLDLTNLTQIPDQQQRHLATSIVVAKLSTSLHLARAAQNLPAVLSALGKLKQVRSTTPVFPQLNDFPEGGAAAAEMVRDWDCALQVLPAVEVKMDAAGAQQRWQWIRQQVLELESLSLQAWKAGVADQRLGSCLGGFEKELAGASLAAEAGNTVLTRVNNQILLSTAYAAALAPTAGPSLNPDLPHSSLAFSALVKLILSTDKPLTTALPGV